MNTYATVYRRMTRKAERAKKTYLAAYGTAEEMFRQLRDKWIEEHSKGRRRKPEIAIPDDDAETIRKRVFDAVPVLELRERWKLTEKRRDKTLDILAKRATHQPRPPHADSDPWIVVQTSSTHTYSSQTQPHFYAKATLQPINRKLQSLGYQTHVQYTKTGDGGRDHYGNSIPETGEYRLWANIPDWYLDAVNRTFMLFEALSLLDRVVNPQVVFGPLPPEIVEQFYAQWH